MRALIVSLGSIGRRHLANLRRMEPAAEITVWRRQSRDTAIPAGADRVVFSLEEALARKPEIAIIATPAVEHVSVGLALARAGTSLLIEKPIATELEETDELVSLCHERGVRAMVGYTLRFHPSLVAVRRAILDGFIGRVLSVRAEVGQYLPEWRGGSDYRQSVSALRRLGGGVVFELSHELDYVRWLGGEIDAVSAETGRLSDLEIDVEDHAEIVLRFASGALGSVHLDMVERAPVRLCRVAGTEGTVVWDGISGAMRLYRAGSGWTDCPPPQGFERNDMFVAELAAFLQSVRDGSEPSVTAAVPFCACSLEEGRRVLEIALACKQSAAEHRSVDVKRKGARFPAPPRQERNR